MEKIDIIIPVYNGLEYLPKLFESIFQNTNQPYRLIIFDDASPDKKVWEFLQTLKNSNPEKEILLFQNENNLGFVKTVNKAVKLAENHFVLLNTDVEVPPGWLGRLIFPILKLKNIASTTPFTNSGTICSFPDFVKDNEIFEGLDASELDKYFQMVKSDWNFVPLPTGIGFCMAFNKSVVDEIGMFDEQTFEKGYGEENDWCQRAIKSGYKNVVVPNLFVYHKHGGSFPSEEKKRLMEENFKKLLKKHPNYAKDVENFIQKDPLKNVRNFLIMLISSNFQKNNQAVLFIDHELGGGANLYRKKYVEKALREDERILLLTYDARKIEYHIKYYYKKYSISYSSSDLGEIKKLFEFVGISKIVLSQLVSYERPLEFLQFIETVKGEKKCALEILIHDYYSICQIFTLLNWKDEYCSVPDLKMCNECLARKKQEYGIRIEIKEQTIWRKAWNEFLSKADKIVLFSNASEEILKKAYTNISDEKIKIIPHEVEKFSVATKKKEQSHPFTIGILGGINKAKGSEIVKEMISIIEKENLDIKIAVIGPLIEKIKSDKLKVLGVYDREKTPLLVAENNVDVFFIPSIWPETFSYTTQEIMNMGHPLAVFNLGAPAERVAKYDKGLIIPKIDAKLALDSIIEFSKKFQ